MGQPETFLRTRISALWERLVWKYHPYVLMVEKMKIWIALKLPVLVVLSYIIFK